MNQTSLSLCALGLLLAAACDADAQCRKFTKQRVISSLDVDQAIDQIKTGTLGRGESAAAVLEVEASGTVDLIICTHPDLGEVTYNVVNTAGRKVTQGSTNGSMTQVAVEVEAEQDLIVHVASERASGAYAPIGCVSLVTAHSTPNELDILSKE